MLSTASPLIVYAITLFTSALLLFLVQPMVGKQILPKLGGAPAVWSTCMLFYQAVLLAGYSYAHFVTKKFPPRKQVLFHFGVLLLPLLAFTIFPLGFAYRSLNPSGNLDSVGEVVLWVLLILTPIIGIPFFVVSTTAPLFQRWFGHTGHPAAKDPYFLYAASNLGSLMALLLYPTVIELNLAIPAQGVVWMVGYVALLGLGAWSGWLVLKQLPAEAEEAEKAEAEAASPASAEAKALAEAPVNGDASEEKALTDKPVQVAVKTKKRRAKDRARAAIQEAITKEPSPPVSTPAPPQTEPEPALVTPADAAGPGVLQYLRWILLGFVPSSLMLGVTMYMSTDIAAVPFLWLIPLLLYLLSFIIVYSQLLNEGFVAGCRSIVRVFSKNPDQVMAGFNMHYFFTLLLPLVVLLLVFVDVSEWHIESLRVRFAVPLLGMFFVAMFCHGELAATRPATQYLTGYYLAMSFGGVLGGIFNALVAPLIFNTVAEYSNVLVVACLLLPPMFDTVRSGFNRVVDIFLALALAAAGTYVIALYIAKVYGLEWQVDKYSRLPDLDHLPAMQMPIVGCIGIALAGGAFVLYVMRAPKPQKSERALDLALPAALFLLTILIIALNPFSRWTKDPNQPDFSLMWTIIDRLFGWAITVPEDRLPNQQGFSVMWAMIDATFGRLITISDGRLLKLFTYGIPVALCYGFAERPVRLGLGVGAILLAVAFQPEFEPEAGTMTVYRERSFFGVLKVEHQFETERRADGSVGYYTEYHRLLHGTTLHGMQRVHWEPSSLHKATLLAPLAFQTPLGVVAGYGHINEIIEDPRQVALTYYHRTGPIGQVYRALIGNSGTNPVAFIGLGTGTMASYCNPGQKVTFYEIDHAVVRIAKDPVHFTYLQGCKERGGDYEMIMGDARLMIEKAPDKHYKVIVVDAFSSDAIPVHLTTREAIELYRRKLTDDGIIAMHISNRYLKLGPVLANIAASLGMTAMEQYDNDDKRYPGKNSSDWVMLAKSRDAFGPLLKDVWRWPDDEYRRWHDLLTPMDASKLTNEDLEDYKKVDLRRLENEVKADLEQSFKLDMSLVQERVNKLDKKDRTDEKIAEINREVAKEQYAKQEEKRLKQVQDEMKALPYAKVRETIQKKINAHQEKELEFRQKVGVWTDDFSNILTIWR